MSEKLEMTRLSEMQELLRDLKAKEDDATLQRWEKSASFYRQLFNVKEPSQGDKVDQDNNELSVNELNEPNEEDVQKTQKVAAETLNSTLSINSNAHIHDKFIILVESNAITKSHLEKVVQESTELKQDIWTMIHGEKMVRFYEISLL